MKSKEMKKREKSPMKENRKYEYGKLIHLLVQSHLTFLSTSYLKKTASVLSFAANAISLQ